MAKITKRSVDALEPQAGRDVFGWDSELRGFGIRVKPSGVKTFLIQYRNAGGRTRRLVLGRYGALAPEVARDLAQAVNRVDSAMTVVMSAFHLCHR